MDLNEGRAPQITNSILFNWIGTNYSAQSLGIGPYPSAGTDGQIIYNETDKTYYQYQTGDNPGWFSLGPNYSHQSIPDTGNLPTGQSALEFYDSKSGAFCQSFPCF